MGNEKSGSEQLLFAELKAKQRANRDSFPESHGLRVHRALSWLRRAEMAYDDDDAAFVFWWIEFNAAYAREIERGPLTGARGEARGSNARKEFEAFFHQVTALDTTHRIYDAIWRRFSQSIRLLIDNRYTFDPFWRFQNGDADSRDWAERFEGSKRWITSQLAARHTVGVLTSVFDRLYVVRNQLVHGGATWNSSVNRAQVRDGAAILAFLIPIFIDMMMDNPSVDWGPPYYPVVD